MEWSFFAYAKQSPSINTSTELNGFYTILDLLPSLGIICLFHWIDAVFVLQHTGMAGKGSMDWTWSIECGAKTTTNWHSKLCTD